MSTSIQPHPVFGPNDFHLKGEQLHPGLGAAEESRIRALRGEFVPVALEEPAGKAELRAQGDALKQKARQLSTVEKELAKEKAALEQDMAAREATLAEREALVAAQLADLAAGGTS